MTDMTTIRVPAQMRDQLAALLPGREPRATLADALEMLLREHQENLIVARYQELMADPVERAALEAELADWDTATGDGLAGE